jgi:hypothetical protein
MGGGNGPPDVMRMQSTPGVLVVVVVVG